MIGYDDDEIVDGGASKTDPMDALKSEMKRVRHALSRWLLRTACEVESGKHLEHSLKIAKRVRLPANDAAYRKSARLSAVWKFKPATLRVQPQPSISVDDIKRLVVPRHVSFEVTRQRMKSGDVTCYICKGSKFIPVPLSTSAAPTVKRFRSEASPNRNVRPLRRTLSGDRSRRASKAPTMAQETRQMDSD